MTLVFFIACGALFVLVGTIGNKITDSAENAMKSGMRMFSKGKSKPGEDTAAVRLADRMNEASSNKVQPKSLFCRQCGKPLMEGASFCSACGSKTE